MKKIEQFQNVLKKIIIWVAAICLSFAIVLAFANTIGRYAFGVSWEWAEEVIRYIIIFVSFFVSAPMITEGGHIAMTIMRDSIPNAKFQWGYKVFCYATTFVAALLLFVWSCTLVANTHPAMKSYSLIFTMRRIYLIIPCTMIFNVIFSVTGLLHELIGRKQIISEHEEAEALKAIEGKDGEEA